MAQASGPSPKRRRIDPASTTISPEQILQSNATVAHFTGQRHNRWMQGYNASAGNGGDTTAASRVVNRPTGSEPDIGMAGRETRSAAESVQDQCTSRTEANDMAARANWQLPAGEAGANMTSDPLAVSAARATVVDYESPYPSFAAPTTNGRKSMERNSSVATNVNPGLPSPAPSDETNNSPIAGVPSLPSTMNVPNAAVPPRRRGRPPKNPPPVLPSNSTPTPLASTRQQQQSPAAPPGMFGNGGRSRQSSASSVQHVFTVDNQRIPPNGQGSPSIAQPPFRSPATPSETRLSMVAPQALRASIDAFEHSQLSHSRVPGVDEGRLSLLRDAVWPDLDWFYLVLSQVHALMELNSPDLPEVIRVLPPACFKHLDDILCSNKIVSSNLLNWLAAFPAPMATIYSHAALSRQYNKCIDLVAAFLRELPTKWDGLVRHCRQMQAPPLAQDLAFGLGIGSSVLQLVAFRAIARMIYDAPDDVNVLEHLELLHRCDQQTCDRRNLRTPSEQGRAYQAFRRVRGAWIHWSQMRHQHDMMQQNLPPMSRTVFQPFSLQLFCPDVPQIFSRQVPPSPAPSNAPSFVQQQARTALQQQQAMFANEQTLRLQASNQSSTPARPPAQGNNVDMPPRQLPNGAATAVPMPAQSRPPNPRLLVFPHETDLPRSQPTEPNATRSALHEAHLRSPVPVPLQINGEMPRLYRYVCKYALSPTPLDKSMPINTLTFDLPRGEFDRIPKTIPSQNVGELDNRNLSESSQTYRLRCCAKPPKGFLTESDWTMADTHWPESMYLDLNGHQLQPRRPLHHKKYLPIDLTSFVKPGVNEVRVIVNRTSTDTSPFNFAMAVETVGVVSHSTLLSKLCTEQTISAASTKASIQKALSSTNSTATSDDDDIAITSTSMTITLFDPFSGSRIFDTPVRGSGCRHKDCFDLETFLAQCKRDKPGMPTVVDCWRCPLCRGDVRPSVLVRDEWLVEVREVLEAQGKLGTRAIVVEADGSWKGKVEERTGVRSGSLEREERGLGAGRVGSGEGTPVEGTVPVSKKKKKVIEIIELD